MIRRGGLAYDAAGASDIVDAAPSVACLPASGSAVPGRLDHRDLHRE